MKKALLSVMALAGVITVNAQLFEVGRTTEVTLPAGSAAEQAVISSDGSKIAFVDMHGAGLQLINLSTGSVTAVSPSASGLDLAFSNDGATLVFDQISYRGHERHVAVKSYDIASGKTATLVSDTRNLQGVSARGGNITAIDGGKARTRRIGSAPAAPVLSIDHGQLCITAGGNTTVLSPLGRDGMSYLWPSLSPDGKRICFYAAGMGCYTCALDGSDCRKVGRLRAAQWYDNNTVVGMLDRNDGQFTTESAIIARSIDGVSSQTITPAAHVAVLPSVADGKIAYSTVDGRVFVVDVTKK